MSVAINNDEVLALIRHRLLASPAVVAFTSDRIVGAYGENADIGTMPKPMVVFRFAYGAKTHHSALVAQMPMELWALSVVSQSEARRLYHACTEALNMEQLEVTGNPHKGTMVQTGFPVEDWYAAASAWYCMGRWQVNVVRIYP